MLNQYRAYALNRLAGLGPGLLPFADIATKELPLGRLLRLSLFQVSVGMAFVLLVGTLNRVMIVELGVPASIVAVMIALPMVFAPFRALIGFQSDTHVSALGWRRVPFIWRGSMYQFAGFAVMPFALLVLSGYMDAATLPPWIGIASAGVAFLLVGAGAHMVQTVGLALATDLATPENQPKIVGLMYVMLLVGMMASALVFGALLSDFTPGKLIRVIQGAAVLTLVLNVIAVWKQEPRDRQRARSAAPSEDFGAAWRTFISGGPVTQRLAVIAIGTMGLGMADVLLEPYGGEVLGLSVAATTRLTATFAIGGLIGFGVASHLLGGGKRDPMGFAMAGLAIGLPAFGAIIAAAPLQSIALFLIGTFLVGFSTGTFAHGTLTATMRAAPKDKSGLALGAWGAVQATAAGLAIALAGAIRDGMTALPIGRGDGAAAGYQTVYMLEVALILAALFVARRTLGQGEPARQSGPSAPTPDTPRAAL